MGHRLVVTLGDASWIHEVAGETEIAGRDPSAGLHLEDDRCSRRHLRLSSTPEGLAFEDLGTLNGTLLNGIPARSGILKEGDVLEIGRSRLVYRNAARGADLLLSCDGVTRLYEMGRHEILIGRDPACDLRVEDPACSRRQARISESPEGLRIESLGSVNPTLLNGHTLKGAAPLSPGDRIAFGRCELRLLVPGEPTPSTHHERVLLTRRPKEAGFPLLPLGAAAAALLLLACLLSHHRERAPSPSPPAPPVAAPPRGAGAAEALANARLSETERPGDFETAIRAFHDVARDFPGTPEAAQAMEAARRVQACREMAEDARLEGILQAAEELVRAGQPRLARDALAAALENTPADSERRRKVDARLAHLDDGIDQELRRADDEALRLAHLNRFEEARALLRGQRDLLAGLPWGSTAETRLQALDALEAEAEKARALREEESRTEAERREREEDREARERKLVHLLRTLSPDERTTRRGAFAGLLGFDPKPRPCILEALLEAQGRRLKEVDEKLKGPALKELRKQLKGGLSESRRSALSLILDERRYPYPPGPDGAKVQSEVDCLIRAVEEAYRPAHELVKAVRSLAGFEALVSDLEELEGYLKACGHPLDRGDAMDGLLEARLKVDVSGENALDKAASGILAGNERVEQALLKQGTLDGLEARCILLTNRYRILLGLLPLKIEPLLCEASRFHSRDMETRRYFDHFDPDGKGPGARALAAGFRGYVSENIHMGSGAAEGAFKGWCHSSGHHRNLLTPQWTVIGVGRSGVYWTMMPGLTP